MEANAVLRCRLFELRDRLKAETRKTTGRSQRICSDEAISEMSVIRPRRASDFGLIQGLGKMFVRNYAQEFLSVLNAYSEETDGRTEEVRMREEVECTLQELEKKLVNISRGNRLLFMPRATNSKEAFDLTQVMHECDPLSVLTDRTSKVRLATASSKTCDGKKSDFHGKLSQLYRNINRIAREKGHNDLYIGYPFVEGCLPGERFDVRGPLALFPVEMYRTQDAICIRYDETRDAVFNNNLILGYFKMNGITRPLPDNILGEIAPEEVIGKVLEFYSAAGLEITDDGKGGFEKFANYRNDAFPEHACGELRLVKNIILGRFPTYSSSIQKDFIDIIGKHMANPVLDELLSSPAKEVPDIEPRDIPEAELTYINDLNASQEQVLDAVSRYDRLVIQGPPGTGKSQTITSIIADHVSRGKTVLMVSEKKAALDVVHSRLGDLSKYCVLIDDVNSKQPFYSQMDAITTMATVSEQPSESPEDISQEIQARFDVLDAIERTIYDTDRPGSEPYSLYVSGSRPDPSVKSELRQYREFRGIFTDRILDYGMPAIADMHVRFGRRSLMTDINDCLEMRAQHPWMMDLRPDLNDYDLEQARIDLTDLKKEIVQWKNSGFFTKMMGKTGMKSRIEEVMSRYFTYYRCSEPSATEYELEEYLNGLAHYDEFATVNNIYESLPECGKLYVEMMRRGDEEEICSPNLMNDKLYSFTSLQYLQRFESENKAILRDVEMFDSLISEVNGLVERKEQAVRTSLDRKLSSYLESVKTSKRFPEMRRAIEMKRRWSINKFVSRFDYELFSGIRVWLMTPDVVSEILPLNAGMFDLVIFDEASQMFMEKGVPSIMRGKRIVIAGDHRQLRPSKLGSGRIGMDEDDAEDDQSPVCQESDSLLDAARSRYPSVMLRYHYRSRYEELIEFSNRAFYDGRLCVSPNLVPETEPPIEVHRIDDGRWSDRCNLPEGKRVVDLISEILSKKGDETVGIITFNSAQMDLIDSLLEDRCASDPAFAELYRRETGRRENGEDVGLFVRNIENVQGDERDIIIFSVGYAKGDNGKLVRNFGWLNQYGGENRLNVAITRARRKIHIVTSFDPSELEVDDMKNRGPKLLKLYLQYCDAVSSGDRMGVGNVLKSVDGLHQSSENPEDDRFADRVFDALRSEGLDVVRDVGAGGYGIDIAIRKEGRFVLGIECDGRLYHSTMSTRERDWHRRRYLESRGWNVTRAWCADWWRDPKAAADGIAKAVEAL